MHLRVPPPLREGDVSFSDSLFFPAIRMHLFCLMMCNREMMAIRRDDRGRDVLSVFCNICVFRCAYRVEGDPRPRFSLFFFPNPLSLHSRRHPSRSRRAHRSWVRGKRASENGRRERKKSRRETPKQKTAGDQRRINKEKEEKDKMPYLFGKIIHQGKKSIKEYNGVSRCVADDEVFFLLTISEEDVAKRASLPFSCISRRVRKLYGVPGLRPSSSRGRSTRQRRTGTVFGRRRENPKKKPKRDGKVPQMDR